MVVMSAAAGCFDSLALRSAERKARSDDRVDLAIPGLDRLQGAQKSAPKVFGT
jgi:hypothetical protein